MNDDYRAAMVAAIRALADFVETRTDLPVPNSVHAQHSLTTREMANAYVVREAAEALGIEPRVSDDAASVSCDISPYPVMVDYAVHGFLTDTAAKACSTCDGERVIECYGAYPGGPTACIDCNGTGKMSCPDCSKAGA